MFTLGNKYIEILYIQTTALKCENILKFGT